MEGNSGGDNRLKGAVRPMATCAIQLAVRAGIDVFFEGAGQLGDRQAVKLVVRSVKASVASEVVGEVEDVKTWSTGTSSPVDCP